jgi:hypothetical protein
MGGGKLFVGYDRLESEVSRVEESLGAALLLLVSIETCSVLVCSFTAAHYVSCGRSQTWRENNRNAELRSILYHLRLYWVGEQQMCWRSVGYPRCQQDLIGRFIYAWTSSRPSLARRDLQNRTPSSRRKKKSFNSVDWKVSRSRVGTSYYTTDSYWYIILIGNMAGTSTAGLLSHSRTIHS